MSVYAGAYGRNYLEANFRMRKRSARTSAWWTSLPTQNWCGPSYMELSLDSLGFFGAI